jgi:hypothetical protein
VLLRKAHHEMRPMKLGERFSSALYVTIRVSCR